MPTRMMIQKAKQYRRSVALLLVPVGIWAAKGASRMEKTFETTSTPRISVSNLAGNVVVKGWDKSEVHALCIVASPRVEVDAERMPANGQADKIHFATHVLDAQVSAQDRAVDYTLEIPAGSSLEIHNPEGSVMVESLDGDDWVKSVGGPVSVMDASGHLSVQSVGGNLELIRPSGRVEAFTVTGNIHFVAPASSKIRAETTSGNILYEGDFVSAGDYVLSSYSGDMKILCPPAASFELRARTVRGKVDNQLALTPKQHVPFSYGNSLFGTHNDGNATATVELTSFSGNIHIRPRP